MITIRQAKQSDIEEIRKVKPDLSDVQIKNRFKWQADKKAVWLVAVKNDQICGFLVLKWFGKKTAPDYPDVEDLFIRPEDRGQGIAGIIVQNAENMARNKGYHRLGMAVNPDPRCPANKLYRKLGYQEVNGKRYVDGVYGGVKDWVVDMVKELKP